MAFDLKLTVQAISCILAGVFCVLITLFIERFGGLIGGIVGSIPTIIVIDALGLYITKSISHNWKDDNLLVLDYQATALALPLSILVNVAYLYCWSVLPDLIGKRAKNYSVKKLIVFVLVISLAIWFVLATITVFSREAAAKWINDNYPKSDSLEKTAFSTRSVAYFVFAIVWTLLSLILGVWFSWKPVASNRGKVNLTWWALTLRAVLTSLVRVIAYAVGSIENIPKAISGMIFLFPMVLSTIMVSVTLSSGKGVSRGAIGPLMIGMSGGGVYLVLTSVFVAYMHYTAVIALSFFISVTTVNLPAFYYLRWRRSKLNVCPKL